MKNLFISQPMHDLVAMQNLKDKDIRRVRGNAQVNAERICRQDLNVLDSYLPDMYAAGVNVERRVIALLLKADFAYFAYGWDDCDGCCLEHRIAEKCKMPIIEETDEGILLRNFVGLNMSTKEDTEE